MKYSNLQNGSDIRGIAVETEHEKVNLDAQTVFELARGFVAYLNNKYDKEAFVVAVGHDSRITSDALQKSICEGLKASGCQVFACGLASTPSMFMSTIFSEFNCDAAIMVTASHLPYNRNGMKFFDRDGGLDKNNIKSIIEYASNQEYMDGVGSIINKPILPHYSQHLIAMVQTALDDEDNYEQPLRDLHVVVDAGNGAGGFYATDVLQKLGATIQGSQFLEPDGMFPNHIPNPENQDAMNAIIRAVKKHKADLGIIFDTDVDRSSAVDASGQAISRNAIVALSAAIVKQTYKHTAIVTDSLTSSELHDFLVNDLKLQHVRYMRGYKNVINKAMELNQAGVDCQLAIETSGHAAFKENYFLDDGAYLATKIVIEAARLKKQGKNIQALIATLNHPHEQFEFRLPILSNDFQMYGNRVLDDLATFGQSNQWLLADDNYEGLRFVFQSTNENGWLLLRKSLHDPLLALNVESKVEGGCVKIIQALLTFLEQHKELDLTSLQAFITK